MGQPHLRPVRIAQDALGDGTPESDLYVSQQHRVFVRSRIAERMFGTKEVLVPAKELVGLDGISVSTSFIPLTYHHLMLDKHDIIYANGALCESLYPGPEALKTLRQIAMSPEVPIADDPEQSFAFPKVRPFATGSKGRSLARRHKKNNRDLNTSKTRK